MNKKTKIAVFSDIHGNYQAAKTIMDDIKKNSFNEIICLGDIIGIGPKSRECLDLILKSAITIIAGNHDLYYKYGIEIDNKITEENEIKHHKWIHSSIQDVISRGDMDFPLSKELNFNNKKILFQHYMLNEDLEKDSFPFERISIRNMTDIENYCENMKCDCLFIGHEHRAFKVEKNNKNIICIGSSGCVKENKTFYTIIEINDNDITITKKELEFDRDSFIKDMKSYKYPDQEFIGKVMFGIENLQK